MEHFLYDTHTNIYTHFFKPLYDSLGGPFRSVWIWPQFRQAKQKMAVGYLKK